MQNAPASQTDPIRWCVAIALAFLALSWHRLGIPSKIYFDEVHYVPAARKLLELVPANNEHPLVGKEIIAASIALLGDKPLYWRVPSALFGALGLFAFGRMLWWASGRRFATIAGMLLLASGFAWFIQSRIAMLDMFCAGFGMLAFWQFAAALRLPAPAARRRIALCGVFLGLALGAKWSIAPAAMLPGLIFLAMRLRTSGRAFLIDRTAGPVRGMTVLEAATWLGVVPLAVYWLTFAPAFFYTTHPVGPLDFITRHEYMLKLQDSVKKHHTYQSVWYQWVTNWRPIWYLYEQVDGAQRGVLLLGNPFTMLAGLPAVLWSLWAGLARKRYEALVFALAYLLSVGMWIDSGKPVQFYYHYLLPGTFLLACLALALDALWQRRDRARWLAPLAVLVSAAMFAWFYPIISSAALEGRGAFNHWMWLHSWR